MTKPITGQYEYQHSSGVGLDYFTSRLDRLTLLANGRFVLIIQGRSRLSNAAQSVVKGQPVNMSAPEVRFEGSYTAQGNTLAFHFDDGTQEQGQISWNGEGMQFGPNFFSKVSDSTLLPPAHRLKKDMDDIAKGLKIASTIGGMAVKAAKTIHDTVQTAQGNETEATPTAYHTPATPPVQQPQTSGPAQPTPSSAAVFCDQCGERVRPGKRFCNHCGAPLP
ncbi:MAG TPA: zinc ribbon domain-containing protein [Ktedonobacteraceae bacterium]|nr:zinc ribbon domain-containing protein [Ktedonobacteraceae bacterium]